MRENSRLLTNRRATCCRDVMGGLGQREVEMFRQTGKKQGRDIDSLNDKIHS